MYSILNIHCTLRKSDGDTLSIMELIKNDDFKKLSDIGFRFNSRSGFSIVNNLK
jgi:hypothetical protein